MCRVFNADIERTLSYERDVFRTLIAIHDRIFCEKYFTASRHNRSLKLQGVLEAANYFRIKIPHKYFIQDSKHTSVLIN